MTPEEFYKTQFTHPAQMDNYYKSGIRFSYNDMIKFAQDYHDKVMAYYDEKTAEHFSCTRCWALNEEDCCCNQNDEE